MRPPGNLRDGLIEFINTLPDGCVIIEVGCYTGESSELFLRKATLLHCVDPWLPFSDPGDREMGGISNTRAMEKLFDKRMAPHEQKYLKHKSKSPQAARLFADFSADCVYIDAAHNEQAVTDDIRAWIWKVRPGGILAGHDYGHLDYGGVKRAVDKHFGHPDRIFPDTTWIIKGGADGPVQRLVPGPISGQPLSGNRLEQGRATFNLAGLGQPARATITNILDL